MNSPKLWGVIFLGGSLLGLALLFSSNSGLMTTLSILWRGKT